jgi:hypothetical protein
MGTVWGASWNFKKIIYENEFQNPQIFKQTISLFPEYSTLEVAFLKETKIMMMAICRPRKLAEGKFAPQKWHGMPIFKIAGYYKTYHVGAFLYYFVSHLRLYVHIMLTDLLTQFWPILATFYELKITFLKKVGRASSGDLFSI